MGFIVSTSKQQQRKLLLSLDTIHEYVLAKLEFLLGLFRYNVKIVRNQVALIVQYLPDFFYQVCLYNKKNLKVCFLDK